MKVIPFVLTVLFKTQTEFVYDSYDIQVCSIEECQKRANNFKSANKFSNAICFQNVPKDNVPMLVTKECKK